MALLREPLVHFLAIGLGLFLLFELLDGGRSGGEDRIVVSRARVEQLREGFRSTWRRPPSGAELAALVDDYVLEEMLVREALALGLDEDDTIVRRRLRQKMEFLSEELLPAPEPTRAELEAWLAAHPESYRTPARVSFRQVFASRDRHGVAARARAARLVERLRSGGPEVERTALGDPIDLPREVERASAPEVAGRFGERFAARVFELAPGHWAGPVESAYGFHAVLVTGTEPARTPDLDEVRTAVERDWGAARQAEARAALLERLRERYEVVVEDGAP